MIYFLSPFPEPFQTPEMTLVQHVGKRAPLLVGIYARKQVRPYEYTCSVYFFYRMGSGSVFPKSKKRWTSSKVRGKEKVSMQGR